MLERPSFSGSGTTQLFIEFLLPGVCLPWPLCKAEGLACICGVLCRWHACCVLKCLLGGSSSSTQLAHVPGNVCKLGFMIPQATARQHLDYGTVGSVRSMCWTQVFRAVSDNCFSAQL